MYRTFASVEELMHKFALLYEKVLVHKQYVAAFRRISNLIIRFLLRNMFHQISHG